MNSKIDRSVFVGNSNDPQPIFRDEAADAADWPEGAVFAVQFTPENCPDASVTQCEIPRTEFFATDGWPLELPVERKRLMPPEMLKEFQAFPRSWRRWSEREWARVLVHPGSFSRLRMRQGAIVRELVGITSSFCKG